MKIKDIDVSLKDILFEWNKFFYLYIALLYKLKKVGTSRLVICIISLNECSTLFSYHVTAIGGNDIGSPISHFELVF